MFPSPLAGEGRMRGHIPNFSQLPFHKGEMEDAWKAIQNL
jgi:hypothetical protein